MVDACQRWDRRPREERESVKVEDATQSSPRINSWRKDTPQCRQAHTLQSTTIVMFNISLKIWWGFGFVKRVWEGTRCNILFHLWAMPTTSAPYPRTVLPHSKQAIQKYYRKSQASSLGITEDLWHQAWRLTNGVHYLPRDSYKRTMTKLNLVIKAKLHLEGFD